MCSAYKRSTQSHSIGFLFGCDSIRCLVRNGDERIAIEDVGYTCGKCKVHTGRAWDAEAWGHTQWCRPATVRIWHGHATQYRPCRPESPPMKKIRTEEDNATSDDEAEDTDTSQGPLVPISEAAATFLEIAFSTKLDNNARKAKTKANGTPVSRWIQCAKPDPVVSVNVPGSARTADRASSRIQNFRLDAATLLIFVLEKAEELELPAEVIVGIQTSLLWMGNANY